MTPDFWALISILGVLLGAIILHFFQSPKDAHGALSSRLTNLESAHTTLALRFEGTFAKHDGAISHLTKAIEELTDEVKNLQKIVGGLGSARRK